jgi:flagellum-specific peptidoglycan hydrolase FlgJ
MTIRKERRRKEKRLNRSLLTAKGLTVATTVVAGSTLAPNLGLAMETTISEDAKNQAEIAEKQVSAESQETVSTVESTQSSVEETTSTEATVESTAPVEEQTDTSVSEETTTNEDTSTQESIAEKVPVVDTPTVAAPALASIPSIFSTRADTSGFIAKASGYAKEVAAANNLYASVMIAQAILESGWGTSTLTTQANNMFGIKGSYNGQYVEMATLEDNGSGNYYQILAKFRKYPSLRESFEDNAYVLRNTSFTAGSYYYSGAWLSNTTSYTEATAWLQGRYATDTSYASKLNNLIATYNLTQYDSVSSATGDNGGANLINTSTGTKEDAIQKQMKTTTAMNVRSDASTTSAITGSLAANTTISVVATKTGTSVNGNTTWYKISGKGWVSVVTPKS